MSEVFAERQKAYERLAAIVQRFHDEGRGTRSAAVKPALQYSDEGFDENRLGFRSFRAFVEAAAEAGYVALRPAPRGPDVDVLPKTEVPAATPAAQGAGRIRRDLWAAFIDWRSDWARVYDRQTDRVGWLPLPERAAEDEPFLRLRRAIADEPERYARIEPIDQETTLRWMNEFTDQLEEGAEQAALRTALTSTTPIRAFVLAAREVGAHERWNRFRLERVHEHIASWSSEHDLTPELTTEHAQLTSTGGRPPAGGRRQAPAGAADSLDELRERVCRAVRQMSRGELLKLAIPLDYVLGDDGR
jgi:hypothetical protein